MRKPGDVFSTLYRIELLALPLQNPTFYEEYPDVWMPECFADACCHRYPTPPQAGALIGVGRSAIISWTLKHGLSAEILPSGRYRIRRKAFLSWLKQRGMKVTEVVP